MFYVGGNTLYVFGLQNPKEILIRALNHKCNIVRLGYKKSFTPETLEPLNDWNYIFESLTDAKISIELELTENFKEHIEVWDWFNYNKFTPLYNAPIDPTDIEKIE
mgnify:CR=1 FL=1|tara:strand:- start:207 stop:524 length:318 start_codon:yes stop_codon:yes gene_type:complete